jgi:hypothetical protein
MSGNANNSQKPLPLIKAAGLWAKSSVKGGQYLTGRWGALKVLVMENRDRKGDDDPSHILYFTEAPDRRQLAQERSGAVEAPQTPPTPQRPSQPHRSGFQGHGQRVPDHQAPLHRDGQPPVRDSLDDVPEWAR